MYNGFSWAAEPVSGRLFLVYLVAVSCFSFFQIVRVTRYVFSNRKDVASANVRHLWWMRYADARSVKSVGIFTLFLSLALIGGIHSEFMDWFENGKVTGEHALITAGFAFCRRFANAVGVSAVFYGSGSWLETRLIRRKTNSLESSAMAKADWMEPLP